MPNKLRDLYNKYVYFRTVQSGKQTLCKFNKGGYIFNDEPHQAERIHILANGPSLNETISFIKENDDVYTVNYALNDEKIRSLIPKQHFIICDNMGLDKEYLGLLKECIDEKTIETLVMSPSIYEYWKNLYSDDGVKVINDQRWNEPYNSKRDKDNYKNNILSPMFQTVVIAAIYGAVQNNYKEIYLHGNDFSFLSDVSVNMNNHLISASSHFYDSEAVDYTDTMGWNLTDWLEKVLLMLKGYQQVKDYAEDMGAKIYNLSKKSMLDIFEKMQESW